MLKRIIAALCALALVFVASPAQASTQFGCPDDKVCLSQWEHHGGDQWQSTLYNFTTHANGCINLSPATWSNGTPVNDNSGSWVVNNILGHWDNYRVYFYDWVNCNANGDNLYTFLGGGGTVYNGGDAISPFYHRITSIQLIYMA